MKKSKLTAIGITTVLLLSGCQNDTAAKQNDELQQQISELQQQVSELQQELSAETEAKKTLESLFASSSLMISDDTQVSETSGNQDASQTSAQPQENQDTVQSSTQPQESQDAAQSSAQQNNQNAQPTQQQSAASASTHYEEHHEDIHHTSSLQPSANTSSQTTNATTENANTQQSTAQTKLDELSATVDSFTNDVASILASSANKSIEQFFTYKQTAEQIDNSLDQYEDWLESQYNQKAMTRDEYKSYERALDKLEDKLDDAEDNLEYGFGIDD